MESLNLGMNDAMKDPVGTARNTAGIGQSFVTAAKTAAHTTHAAEIANPITWPRVIAFELSLRASSAISIRRVFCLASSLAISNRASCSFSAIATTRSASPGTAMSYCFRISGCGNGPSNVSCLVAIFAAESGGCAIACFTASADGFLFCCRDFWAHIFDDLGEVAGNVPHVLRWRYVRTLFELLCNVCLDGIGRYRRERRCHSVNQTDEEFFCHKANLFQHQNYSEFLGTVRHKSASSLHKKAARRRLWICLFSPTSRVARSQAH